MVSIPPLLPFIRRLASMRVAVLLLGVLALAATAGTLVEQNQPSQLYLTAFGPFWSGFFGLLGVFHVFQTPWFLGILLFLACSLGFCLFLNGPLIFRQIFARPTWSAARIKTLPQAPPNFTPPRSAHRGQMYVDGTIEITLFQQGVLNRLGYFGVHAGLLLVLVAGLLSAFGWRGLVQLPTGASTQIAYEIHKGERLIERPLPVQLTNKNFEIVYHPNGQPAQFSTTLFVSPLTHIHKNPPQEVLVQVNQPFARGGYQFFQSSFTDSGSHARFAVLNLHTGAKKPLNLHVGQTASMEGISVEFLAFRTHTPTPVFKQQTQMQPTPENFGPSADYILSTPTATPLKLRSYQNHPNLLGIANQADNFTPVFLGVSMRDVTPEHGKLLSALAALPNTAPDKLKHLQTISEPYLKTLPEEERYAALLTLLQAWNVFSEFNLSALVTLEEGTESLATVLQVNYDPGAWLFWPASLLLCLGILAMLYAPYRQMWRLRTLGKTTYHIQTNLGFWALLQADSTPEKS